MKIGEPVSLAAVAKDPDNIPARRGSAKPPAGRTDADASRARGAVPPARHRSSRISGAGAAHSRGSVYRGNAAAVTFKPDQMKTWTDTRAYANSPWSPPWTIPLPPADNKWQTQATFSEPGTYVLRGVASDGSLFTYENVTVIVTKYGSNQPIVTDSRAPDTSPPPPAPDRSSPRRADSAARDTPTTMRSSRSSRSDARCR